MLEYWLYDILGKTEDSRSTLNCGYDSPYRLELAMALRTGKGFEVLEIFRSLALGLVVGETTLSGIS